MRPTTLRPNARSSSPRYHIALATAVRRELAPVVTDAWTPECLAWRAWRVSYEGLPATVGDWTEGQTRGEWWSWLASRLRRKHPTWVWVLDAPLALAALHLTQELDEGRLHYDWGCWSAKPFIVSCQSATGRVLFLDVANWVDLGDTEFCALAGESLAVTTPFPPASALEVEQLHPRVTALAKVVRAILGYHRDNDCGILRPTVAGQAFQLWRHRLGPRFSLVEVVSNAPDGGRVPAVERVWPLPDRDERAVRLARLAVFGGVFRCFFVGRREGPIYVLDQAAAYGRVLIDENLPVRLVGVREPCSVVELRALADQFCCIASVRVSSDNYSYPYGTKGSNEWCVGEFDTVLAGRELVHALASDHIAYCYACAYYQSAPIFRAYGEELWRLRQHYQAGGHPIEDKISKVLLAALWGKFNQHNTRWRVNRGIVAEYRWGSFFAPDPQTGLMCECRGIGGVTEQRVGEDLAPHAMPAVAACVTAAARWRSWQLVQQAGPKHCYYLAVDALHVDAVGVENLRSVLPLRVGRPGDLALKQTLPWAHYYGPCAWWTEGERSISGIPTDAPEVRPGVFRCPVSAGLCQAPYNGPWRSELSTYRDVNLAGWLSDLPEDEDGWTRPQRIEREDAINF